MTAQRRVILPVMLFGLTCIATFWAGAHATIGTSLVGDEVVMHVRAAWRDGLIYMSAVMAILLAHELGHFLQAVRYGVPASLPYFIPMPLTPIGTMGAVIGMPGCHADRKQMFDIGISGPLAGLLVATPILIYGVLQAKPVDLPPGQVTAYFGDPLVLKLMLRWLRPEIPGEFFMNPLLMAGWVGLLVTGLNMIPVSQLDGGHVAYALFGKRAHLLARAFVLGAIGFMLLTNQYQWSVMLILVTIIGTDHPPTSNDEMPLGWFRRVLGLLSLAIPIFCIAPVPMSLVRT
jgi:membrane-associated protease RseP (regulator of RpoE activity)